MQTLIQRLLQNVSDCAEKLLLRCCIMFAKCYLLPLQALLSESWTASVVYVMARLQTKALQPLPLFSVQSEQK